MLQLLKLALRPCDLQQEKPPQEALSPPPLAATRESLCTPTKMQHNDEMSKDLNSKIILKVISSVPEVSISVEIRKG